MRYSRTSSGSVSGSCDKCKRQTFDRSPLAVGALEKKLAAGKPNGGEPKDEKKGEAFDMSKL